MESVVADAVVSEARQRRRVDGTAKGVRQAKADVIEHDDQDVGCALGQAGVCGEWHQLGFLQRRAGDTCTWLRRKRQNGAVSGR